MNTNDGNRNATNHVHYFKVMEVNFSNQSSVLKIVQNIFIFSACAILKCKIFWLILSQTILSLIKFLEKNNILNVK